MSIKEFRNRKNVHPLDYIKPSDEEVRLMKEINVPLKDLYDLIDAKLGESADKTVVLRKLTEIRMLVNQAIILN